MIDAQTAWMQMYETMQQEIARVTARYHPSNIMPSYTDGGVAASEADVEQSETDVHAAENEPGLGDGSADPVRQAEQSRGLSAPPLTPGLYAPAPPAPAPLPGVAPADAARLAMEAALRATRAALVQNVAMIDQSLAAADLAVRQAMAAGASTAGGGRWSD